MEYIQNNVSDSLIKGLKYILKAQNDDGGWSTRYNQPSDPAATAHILYMLYRLGCFSVKPSLKALSWLDKVALRDGQQLIGWGKDELWGPEIDFPSTILGSISILRAEDERILAFDFKKEVTSIILKKTSEFLIEPTQQGQAIWWKYWELMEALYAAKYDGHLWSALTEYARQMRIGEIWDADRGEWEKETAEVILGLLKCPSIPIDLIEPAVEKIIENAVSIRDMNYWEPHGAPGPTKGGPFFITRWVLMALQEVSDSEINHPQLNICVDSGIKWLLEKQRNDGSWTEWNSNVVIPSTNGYAVLILGNYFRVANGLSIAELGDYICKEIAKLDKVEPFNPVNKSIYKKTGRHIIKGSSEPTIQEDEKILLQEIIMNSKLLQDNIHDNLSVLEGMLHKVLELKKMNDDEDQKSLFQKVFNSIKAEPNFMGFGVDIKRLLEEVVKAVTNKE